MLKIAIIGCGSMGMTYANSFLRFNLVSSDRLLLIEKSEERKKKLEAMNSGIVTSQIDETIKDYGVIILAVKPQDFNDSIGVALSEVLEPHHVVLSIMAGITIKTIRDALNHDCIIRAMPNTPAQLGMGITAFSAHEKVNVHQISITDNLLNTTGRTVFLENESLLDAVTALSGSGPAYFYYIVQSMIDAGTKLGLDESVSAMLVKQTMNGAFHLMNQSTDPIEELIKAVASKGGTTEAALKSFKANKLRETLIDGISSAERRAKELSQGK